MRPPLRHLGLFVLAIALSSALVPLAHPPAPSAAPAAHDHMNMSAADMQAKIDAWFAKHPETQSAKPLADPVDTFFAGDYYFDNNGDGANGPDTAFIQPGDAVLWQWVEGSHTTTNGTDPDDPDAGTIWNHNLNMVSPSYVQVFPNEGTYPFYCLPHFFYMYGVVVVQQAVAVRPLDGAAPRIGFLAAPAPNPSSGRVLFRFGLREPGVARAEILDARGRLVAVPVNEHLGAGAFSGVWNGLSTTGAHVSPGVYYVRLTVPGARETKSIVLEP
jgi:plastocyanin